VWELLSEILKQLLASTVTSGIGMGLGALTQGGGPKGASLPGVSGPSLPPGLPPSGTTARPMSLNFTGGFTGQPPDRGPALPGAQEQGGGSGFASLLPGLGGKRGLPLPEQPGRI